LEEAEDHPHGLPLFGSRTAHDPLSSSQPSSAEQLCYLKGGKRKVFEERVEMDEEFAHGGGEGEFGRFAVGAEAEVKGFDDRVLASWPLARAKSRTCLGLSTLMGMPA
jgi:hypothetical protein